MQPSSRPVSRGDRADVALKIQASAALRHGAHLSGGVAKEFKMSDTEISGVEHYLHALAKACEEAADTPRVRPLLFLLLLAAPRTLCELRRAEQQRARRLAA